MLDEARPRAAPAILSAGALAGVLDITAACVQGLLRGRSVVRVLQSVATGWVGRDAYAHGLWSAALGLVTHFGIATTWAAVFWLASRSIPALVRNAWVSGAVYGVFVYAVMYEMVIPLSEIHRRVPRTPQDIVTGLLIHITCVGWPIAMVIAAHTPRRDTSRN